MILQLIRIIVGDAEFEPGPLPKKSGALAMSNHISYLYLSNNSSALFMPKNHSKALFNSS